MSTYQYHKEGHREAMFALSVQCYAHYGAVSSVWIYLGVITPHARKKGKGKEKESKEDKEYKEQQEKARKAREEQADRAKRA